MPTSAAADGHPHAVRTARPRRRLSHNEASTTSTRCSATGGICTRSVTTAPWTVMTSPSSSGEPSSAYHQGAPSSRS